MINISWERYKYSWPGFNSLDPTALFVFSVGDSIGHFRGLFTPTEFPGLSSDPPERSHESVCWWNVKCRWDLTYPLVATE